MATVVQQPLVKNIEAYLPIEKFAGLLVLFLPVGAAIVPHWEGSIYVLLFSSSIYFLTVKRNENIHHLQHDEKILLWCMALYFFVFLFTALINTEWGRVQNKCLGVEIRFLLFVPIYLMIRRIHGLTAIFLKGVVISGGLLGMSALYEIFVLGDSVADGGYFSLYFGSIAALFFTCILFSGFLKEANRVWRILSVLAVGFLIEAAILSEARMAYLAFVVSAFLWPFLFCRRRQLAPVLLLLLTSVFVIYSSSSHVQKRVDQGIKSFSDYFGANKELARKAGLSSVGNRLEMWKVSSFIIQDNFMFGVGRGGYNSAAQHYVDEGLVSSSVTNHSHPHNAFIEMFVSRGLIGMLIFLSVLFFPLYVFIKNYRNTPYISLIGVGFILCITTLSLTDSIVFLRGKFVSIYLVCLACFVASLFEQKASEHLEERLPPTPT